MKQNIQGSRSENTAQFFSSVISNEVAWGGNQAVFIILIFPPQKMKKESWVFHKKIKTLCNCFSKGGGGSTSCRTQKIISWLLQLAWLLLNCCEGLRLTKLSFYEWSARKLWGQRNPAGGRRHKQNGGPRSRGGRRFASASTFPLRPWTSCDSSGPFKGESCTKG